MNLNAKQKAALISLGCGVVFLVCQAAISAISSGVFVLPPSVAGATGTLITVLTYIAQFAHTHETPAITPVQPPVPPLPPAPPAR